MINNNDDVIYHLNYDHDIIKINNVHIYLLKNTLKSREKKNKKVFCHIQLQNVSKILISFLFFYLYF